MKINKSVKGTLLITNQDDVIEHIVIGTPFISVHPKDDNIIVLDHTTGHNYASVRIYVPDITEAFGKEFKGSRNNLMELISQNFSKAGSAAITTMTGSEIKTSYESEVNTNAFTNFEKQKLASITSLSLNLSGTVDIFSNLPKLANANDMYYVRRTTGNYLFGTRRKSGFYTHNGINWDYQNHLPVEVLNESDVIDNITSQITTAPLSANQGRLLQDQITQNTNHITSLEPLLDYKIGVETFNTGIILNGMNHNGNDGESDGTIINNAVSRLWRRNAKGDLIQIDIRSILISGEFVLKSNYTNAKTPNRLIQTCFSIRNGIMILGCNTFNTMSLNDNPIWTINADKRYRIT